MKEYNKEKLNEYAKELFALCLENGIQIEYQDRRFRVYTNLGKGWTYYNSYIDRIFFDEKTDYTLPIWELIEKVKQL